MLLRRWNDKARDRNVCWLSTEIREAFELYSRLVVSDRQDSAEDQIIKSCESAASTTKSSPDSLDFFDIVEQVSTGMVAVY
jgi:hypothetical protein